MQTALSGQEGDPAKPEQRSGCEVPGDSKLERGRTNSPTLLTWMHCCQDSVLSFTELWTRQLGLGGSWTFNHHHAPQLTPTSPGQEPSRRWAISGVNY